MFSAGFWDTFSQEELKRDDPVVKFQLIMFYNYILQSKKNRSLYIGYTTDLKRRLLEHNKGSNPSTKRYRPWEIIYYEACTNRKDAERREGYLKTTQGGRLLKRRLKDFLFEQKVEGFGAEILLQG